MACSDGGEESVCVSSSFPIFQPNGLVRGGALFAVRLKAQCWGTNYALTF